MSDEEKKAIEILKLRLENASLYVRGNNEVFYNALGIVLKLIEKQSKEIEELKEDRDEYKEEYIKLQNARYYNYISKDKIKAKIEELEIEQESNREDLKIAIDNLVFSNIDKIANKISINMSVRGILQSLLEKE